MAVRLTYIENPRIGFHLLVFERDNWQYVLSIDRDVADQVTAEVLINIANSIDYQSKSISPSNFILTFQLFS